MGGAASTVPLFEPSYQQERRELRRELTTHFLRDPRNDDVLRSLSLLRKVVTQHPHLCATARSELKRIESADLGPTTLQSAYHELDRLRTIYETSTVLRSAQCRVGCVACPLGHHAGLFEDLQRLSEDPQRKPVLCSLCDKPAQQGHHCSYCAYSLCLPCSVIYCANGHAMTLWTHAEAQHVCVVCKGFPITSGYRCTACGDYDICDLCTHKDGRAAVQRVILDRMQADLQYIEESQSESETARKTIAVHKKKVQDELYPTTKHLFDFSVDLHEIRAVVFAEVTQTRITNDILRMRKLLSYGQRYSRTAQEEAKKEGNFTAEEQTRLQKLCEWTDTLKSFAVRCQHIVACPLAHAMSPFDGLPEQYALRIRAEEEAAQQKEDEERAARNLPPSKRRHTERDREKDGRAVICKVCDRIAASGFHCDFCEYDLCHICSRVYCGQGHQMIMWTEPYGKERCFLCQSSPLTTGYRCRSCHEDLCDMCTGIDGRNKIRGNWEGEMKTLIAFMKENKRLSDVALYYHWRHNNEIVSIGFLIEYVRELREAKVRAERQIAQKPIIDKIKLLRQEVIKNADLCATAARENNRSENYVFPSKKKASEELLRLAGILREGIAAQSADRRQAARVACPLGHAMEKIVPKAKDIDQEDVFDEAEAMAMIHGGSESLSLSVSAQPSHILSITEQPESGNSARNSLLLPPAQSAEREESDEISNAVVPFDQDLAAKPPSSLSLVNKTPSKRASSQKIYPLPLPTPSHEVDLQRTASIKQVTSRVAEVVNETMNEVISEFPLARVFEPFDGRTCRICATKDLTDGMTCKMCEYDLCVDCSVIYCREGHPCKIWTMPEAETLSCDICKKDSLTAGYRCLTCDVDICDMCTTKDSRNAYLLWPRREFHRHFAHLEHIAADSPTARQYVAQTNADPDKSYLQVMSKLCKKLVEVEEVRKQADEEVRKRIKSVKVRKYGQSAREML